MKSFQNKGYHGVAATAAPYVCLTMLLGGYCARH